MRHEANGKAGLSATDGSITIQTVALLALVATIGFGVALYLATAQLPIANAREKLAERKANLQAIDATLQALRQTPTIEADSAFDPAYSLTDVDGVAVKVEEISSKLNPNWIRKRMLSETNLASLLKPDRDGDQLQQYREDNGLSSDARKFYADYFTDDALKDYIDGYSYANVNSTDEFALRRLYLDVTGNKSGSEFFHNKITQQLSQLKIMNENELEFMLGASGSEVRKVLTTQGQFNANFVDPFVLKAILSFKGLGIAGGAGYADAIVSARKSQEITETRLRSLLGGLNATHPVFGYLGVRSWFWRITATTGKSVTVAIAARQLPFDPTAQEEKIKLIEVRER